MRAAVLFALIFLLCPAVQAQQSKVDQEEQARIDKILKPDQSRVNPMQARQFYGGKDFNQTRNVSAKPFYFTQGVLPGNTVVTRDFAGLKTFQGANATVRTKEFGTHSWPWLSNVAHFFSGKKSGTKQAYDAEKTFTSHAVVETGEYRGPERSAAARTFPNTDKKMSINDVRELLNKNK